MVETEAKKLTKDLKKIAQDANKEGETDMNLRNYSWAMLIAMRCVLSLLVFIILLME